MTTRPAPALVPYIEGLPEFFEAAGLSVRLEVQRADGKPLSAEDRESIAVAVESYQTPGTHTDDELAAAVEADTKAQKRAQKKASPKGSKSTVRTKRAPSRTAALVARQR